MLLGALEASLDIFGLVELPRYFEEVQRFHKRLREQLSEIPQVKILTPADRHGAQVSFQLKVSDPRAAMQRLLQEGFCVDWREPDVIRAAPVALYNLPEEIDAFAEAVAKLAS